MNDRQSRSFFENMCKIGTPECAIFSGAVAMALALLYLTVGFWKMVLFFLVVMLGVFIGGVKDKKGWLKRLINRLFPARQMVPYREENPEIAKAVREATARQSAAEETQEANEETQETDEN